MTNSRRFPCLLGCGIDGGGSGVLLKLRFCLYVSKEVTLLGLFLFVASPLSSRNGLGNDCFKLNSGAKRSPTFFSLLTAVSGSKKSSDGSRLLTAFRSSAQVTGIATNGTSPFALSE